MGLSARADIDEEYQGLQPESCRSCWRSADGFLETPGSLKLSVKFVGNQWEFGLCIYHLLSCSPELRCEILVVAFLAVVWKESCVLRWILIFTTITCVWLFCLPARWTQWVGDALCASSMRADKDYLSLSLRTYAPTYLRTYVLVPMHLRTYVLMYLSTYLSTSIYL
jgi:hypothetical protein